MSRSAIPLLACSALFAASSAPAPALAQEAILLPELLISASQVPITGREAGSAVTVITGEEMEERGEITVADALRGQPGVSVGTTGVRGTVTQVRIRGAESRHTLVMIDGVVANRPGDSAFDFGTLLATDIDRIEVIRGPQSGIYGSNAHAGVINIFTKTGRGLQGVEMDARMEAGTRNSGLFSGALRGGHDRFWGGASFSAATSDGFNVSRFGSERDGFENLTGSLKAGVDVTDWFSVDGVLHMIRHSVESDPEDFAFPATPTYGMVIDGDQETESQDILGRIRARADLLDDTWSHELTGTFIDADVEGFLDGAPNGGSKQSRRNLSYRSTYRFDTPGFFDSHHTLVGMVDAREETYRNTVLSPFSSEPPAFQLGKRTRDQVSFAAEHRVDFGDLVSLSSALRHDLNDGFADATTWRLTGAYLVPGSGTRLHGSTGTGVTNPSMIDQFGTFGAFVGNPDLVPEKSFAWDIGVEQELLDGRLVFDVTYFQSRLEDEFLLVGFAPSTVINLDGISHRRGVEVAAVWNPLEWLSLSGAYTFIDSSDPDGFSELRRPKHSARLDSTMHFHGKRGRFTIGAIYNGEMLDNRFRPWPEPTRRVTLDDYILVDASLAYQVTPEMEVYARAENLFDEDYEDVFSYQGSGLAAYAGLKLTLGAQ